MQIQDGKIYIDGKELTEDICNEEIYNAGFAAEPVKLGYDEFLYLETTETTVTTADIPISER